MTAFHALRSQRLKARWPILLILTIALLTTGSALSAQGAGGLGVGSGFGTEIGVNLDALNRIRIDINNGVYDRPCTAEEHDRHKWHTLVDPVNKCHYDHHHGDDPNYVNDIFGEPGAWFGVPNQSISYPWQTFGATNPYESNAAATAEGRMENDLKHEGYGWVVRRDQACPDGNCVTDFRLQYHIIFGPVDATVRYHSYSLEARVCVDARNPATCGIMRNGGWADFGRLFTTAPGVISCAHDVQDVAIPLPADTLFFPLDRPESRDEIRCHPNVVNLPSNPGSVPLSEWWAHSPGDLARFQIRSYDPLGNINAANPGEWNFFCQYGDASCKYNQSMMSAFIGYVLNIREFFTLNPEIRTDRNRDGRTDLITYTTRWGGYNGNNCTVAGLDCVPMHYDNVQLNLDYNNDGLAEEGRFFHTVCDNCERVDYDLSPAGKSWITWFFKKYGNVTQPPDPTEPTPVPDVPSVVIAVSPQNAAPGDTVNVAFDLYNVSGVYGLQTECMVNPAVLAGTARTDGLFNSGNSFFVDSGFNNGQWLVAASLLSDLADTAISGSGTAYSLRYNVVGAGDSGLSCSVLAVDANGQALDLQVVNGTLITTQPPVVETEPAPEPIPPTPTPVVPMLFSVLGNASYQNRASNAGITVDLLNAADQTLAATTTTDADGAYSFGDISAGSYTLIIRAPQHIPLVYTVEAAGGGGEIMVEAGTLRAGDVNDSGEVDIVDATFVGANFGLDVVPEIANIDLNGDGQINITDLVLVGGNFGLTSPLVP